jgi:hypothetical protein
MLKQVVHTETTVLSQSADQSSKPHGPHCNQISCREMHIINHNKQPREIRGDQNVPKFINQPK